MGTPRRQCLQDRAHRLDPPDGRLNLVNHVATEGAEKAAAALGILPPVRQFDVGILEPRLVIDTKKMERVADKAIDDDAAEKRLGAVETKLGAEHMHDPRRFRGMQHLAGLREVAREGLFANDMTASGDC